MISAEPRSHALQSPVAPYRRSRQSQGIASATWQRSWIPTISTAIRQWPRAQSASSKEERNCPTDRPTGQRCSVAREGKGERNQLAGGLGFEPRLAESESAVLPLDDPPPPGRAAPARA